MDTCLSSLGPTLRKIERDGFGMQAAVFEAGEVEQLRAELGRALSRPEAAVIQTEGAVVGARNLLQSWRAGRGGWVATPAATRLAHRNPRPTRRPGAHALFR